MSVVPPSSFEELAELLGEEDEVTSQFNDNTTVVTKRIEDGFQQVITTKEWVNDKVGKRTTTCVRTYYAAVEDEEEVEENVEEEEIDEERLTQLRANAPPPPPPETETVGKDGKKKKKKQKVEGNADVVREAFEGGYKEITTVIFPDGSHKVLTKMFYDPVEVPKSESQVVEETTTTKSGKKKKVKKVINLNQEVLEEYQDDDNNTVVVAREPFDGGHKDITTVKMPNGQHKQTIQIIFYPKEKEIIETTEILEHEASSIRMNVKETVIKQHYESEETEEKTTKKTKKSSKKVQQQATIESESLQEEQVHQVQIQQIQQSQENGVETKKITKKSTKKTSNDEAQRQAVLARDSAEGVTTVVREKTDKGYREISTTVFSDGSTKTQTREFFDAVEETIDPQQAMQMRDNLALLATQAPQVQKNADGSVSTIVVERIDNGYRQTTTTKKQNGATSVQTREFYDPVEEEVSQNQTTGKRRIVQSKQQIQGVQSNTMKSVKLFG
jgi:hypothetical protein